MKHYGDITQLHGYELPIVDIITGGSPCQNLSLAGNRKGLAGEQSGLFMEQVRIVKEMREHDKTNGRTGYLIRPRYMVWENVKGAFSSNKGRDFQTVLTEIARIVEPECPDVPMPDKGWPKAGCIYDEMGRWSVAWRLHDARAWGVPQRRERIALVADFGGLSAPEVLAEREGMRWYPAESEEQRETVAPDSGSGIDTSGGVSFQEREGKPGGGKGILIQEGHTGALSTVNNQRVLCLNDQGESIMSVSEEQTNSLRAQMKHHEPIVFGICSDGSNSMKSDNPHSGIYEAESARTLDANGGSPACNQGGMAVVYAIEGNGQRKSHRGDGYKESETMYTLNTVEQHAVYCVDQGGGKSAARISEDVSPTLATTHDGAPAVLSVENHPQDGRVSIREDESVQTLSGQMGTGGNNVPLVMEKAVCVGNGQMNQITMKEHANTLDTMHEQQAVMTYGIDRPAFNQGTNAKFDFAIDEETSAPLVARGPNACYHSVVRRLTPTECERLQNFPDGWTDIGDWIDSKGKKRQCSDTSRYKALGNSIALPYWKYLARRICAQYERDCTMGSLFDGIAGFPLVFKRCGATPVWASEIDEFCIAVSKKHFPEDE